MTKYLSSFRKGYAAISLLIPVLNPMSSIAAVEYPIGLDVVIGPEGLVQAHEDQEDSESSRSSSVLGFVGTIHQV